jgi:hypothetical protein
MRARLHPGKQRAKGLEHEPQVGEVILGGSLRRKARLRERLSLERSGTA